MLGRNLAVVLSPNKGSPALAGRGVDRRVKCLVSMKGKVTSRERTEMLY